MTVTFSCLFQNLKFDEKDGGFQVILSVPESDREEMGKLVTMGKVVFHCVLVAQGGEDNGDI